MHLIIMGSTILLFLDVVIFHQHAAVVRAPCGYIVRSMAHYLQVCGSRLCHIKYLTENSVTDIAPEVL